MFLIENVEHTIQHCHKVLKLKNYNILIIKKVFSMREIMNDAWYCGIKKVDMYQAEEIYRLATIILDSQNLSCSLQ